MFSLCPHMAEGMRAFWGPFCQSANEAHSRGLHCHDLVTPAKAPAPNTITLVSKYKFAGGGGEEHTPSIATGNETSLGIEGQVSQKIRCKVF